jgi:hypothetical protein
MKAISNLNTNVQELPDDVLFLMNKHFDCEMLFALAHTSKTLRFFALDAFQKDFLKKANFQNLNVDHDFSWHLAKVQPKSIKDGMLFPTKLCSKCKMWSTNDRSNVCSFCKPMSVLYSPFDFWLEIIQNSVRNMFKDNQKVYWIYQMMNENPQKWAVDMSGKRVKSVKFFEKQLQRYQNAFPNPFCNQVFDSRIVG